MKPRLSSSTVLRGAQCAAAAFGVALLAAGCGGEDSEDSNGSNDGSNACDNIGCVGPFMCVAGSCEPIDGNGSNDGSEGTNGDGPPDDGGPMDDSPPADGGTPTDDADDGSEDTEIYCVVADDGCLCGFSPDFGSLGESCAPEDVGEPALCCGSSGWPSSGGCQCWNISCRLLGPSNDTCTCNIGDVEPENTAVSTCSTAEGVCCKNTSDGSCSCWEDLTECLLEDQVEVSSCSVEDFDCGHDRPTQACN